MMDPPLTEFIACLNRLSNVDLDVNVSGSLVTASLTDTVRRMWLEAKLELE